MTAQRSEIELKLAQMFMVGVKGVELEKSTHEFLESYQPGGIIYFAHNYESPALLAEFSDEMQETRKHKDLPLFIAVDHEGGTVQRFKKQFTHFPESAKLGEIGSPKLVFQVAEVMSKELKAVGVNLNFWPLCDIHTKPNNPVIGKRAFSSDVEIVAKLVSAAVRGFVTHKMVSCVKHYPGHGDTSVDSHKDLPVVEHSWDELLKRELEPFKRSFRSKVDMVMTAHLLNKVIDPDYPATLSVKTISYLRNELRFPRLVITDDMQMEAITKHYGFEDAILLAIKAGNDILLYRDQEMGIKAMDAAFRFLREGKITADQINLSYRRIADIKRKVLLPYQSVQMDDLNVIGCAEHEKVLLQVMSGQSSE